jgi:hypothetical protein
MSRPEAKIDWVKVALLCQEGRNGVQIASTLGIHYNTLYERCKTDNNCEFSEWSQDKRSFGDGELHSMQYKKAMKGDVQMLKWLGEWRLGQKDDKTRQDDTTQLDRDYILAFADLAVKRPELFELLRSTLADKQSVLDKGPTWEQDQVPNELGPKDPL